PKPDQDYRSARYKRPFYLTSVPSVARQHKFVIKSETQGGKLFKNSERINPFSPMLGRPNRLPSRLELGMR
ncbi:hypothetical protein AB9F41_38915, partial [Rhizobium leguminosarum]|uniref:hypothetical protein n=1 Tax=Rhizobium leguminosarum TaxID=384 RepID=UPI003F993AC5